MELSVITATRQRTAQLANCLQQFRAQSIAGFRCEQIVVSDGVDPHAAAMAKSFGARYLELDDALGAFGASAKDAGIQVARGTYVCFWDDDNIYHPHALATLYAAACDVDIGVVRAVHRLRTVSAQVTIPRHWDGGFVKGDIDTMCVCVRTELARREAWAAAHPPVCTDHYWLQQLMQHRPQVRYVPIVIGWHL